MTVEEALELVDSVLVEKRLNDVQEKVFRQSWEGSTYPEIAQKLDYSDAYLRRIGTELWQLLSEGFGERVTKSNFQSVIRRQAVGRGNAQNESVPKPVPSISAPPEVAIALNPPLPPASTDPNFVGREGAIAQLNLLVNQGAKIITVCAPGGVGKTTLAWQYLQNQGFDKILEIWMAKEIQNINSVESEVERWLQQDFGEEPGRDFGVNLERLRQKLRDPNQRIGILIDNLEPALDRNGRFIESHRAYVDFLRVLADPGARSLTLITSRERLCEPSIEIKDYRLEGLDEAAWQECFSNHGIQTNSPTLRAMHQAYSGNAKAMQILSSAIQIDFNGDLEAFWQENEADLLLNSTLENLVSEQFNRLQIIYPEAYRLLCRLGCFRYQDVATVPLHGILCLLWDTSEIQQKRIVKALQDRTLIEAKGARYFLHPLIQAEAIFRLKTSEDWILANRKAASFWEELNNDILDLEKGLESLEAYYHYLNTEEYDKAVVLILGKKTNYSLIGRLRGFGIYSKCLDILNFLAFQSVLSSESKQYVFGYLGDLHAVLGNSEATIYNYQDTLNISSNFKDKIWYCDCLAALALFYLKLGEYQKSAESFETVLSYSNELETEIWENEFAVLRRVGRRILAAVYSCLSFVYYLSKDSTKSKKYLDLAITSQTWIQSNSGSWWEVYGNYFLSRSLSVYKYLNESKNVCLFLYKLSKQFSYPLAKGLAFSSIAEVYLQEKQLKQTTRKLGKAEIILREIEAKCDLAEVCFQFGLTYKAMGEVEKGLEYRDKAIKLFEEMEAPRQVERIRQAFVGSDSQSHN
jgi:tetratricopeptide (TPR) repeat protein